MGKSPRDLIRSGAGLPVKCRAGDGGRSGAVAAAGQPSPTKS